MKGWKNNNDNNVVMWIELHVKGDERTLMYIFWCDWNIMKCNTMSTNINSIYTFRHEKVLKNIIIIFKGLLGY